ncbi:hypothetical protein E2P81_ATG00067 [Venturia nashicola]|nr:hypothetical protein E2P81_ATG00067 [Venturia nashicola]
MTAPLPQKARLTKMKRFFPGRVTNGSAAKAPVDCSAQDSYSSEEEDALTATGSDVIESSEGKLIDEGPLAAMDGVDQAMARMNLHEYNVVYNPTDPTNARRTIMIPNLVLGVNPWTVFQPMIEPDTIRIIHWARTSKMKFRGKDGKAEVYGCDTVRIHFKHAHDAITFYEKVKAYGAIYMPGATNPRF